MISKPTGIRDCLALDGTEQELAPKNADVGERHHTIFSPRHTNTSFPASLRLVVTAPLQPTGGGKGPNVKENTMSTRLSHRQAAQMMCVAPNTLYDWRSRGRR